MVTFFYQNITTWKRVRFIDEMDDVEIEAVVKYVSKSKEISLKRTALFLSGFVSSNLNVKVLMMYHVVKTQNLSPQQFLL